MAKLVEKLFWVILLLSMTACEQLGLTGSEPQSAKLTAEQIKARIVLQQELAGNQELLDQVQSTIDQATEHRAALLLERKDKFDGDSVELGEKPPLGSDQARFALVEFTDYQCPFCARHAGETMPRLKRDYIEPGKLRYYIRDFPLPSHAQARYAAVVALCAAGQGRFWKMHDLLFKNQKRLDPRLYLNLSNEIGLDPTRLSDCLTGADAIDKVNGDSIYGQSIGVDSTPKFFVGRIDGDRIIDVITIKGALPYPNFSSVIDNFLDVDATWLGV